MDPIEKPLQLLRRFPQVAAIGLSGSVSRGLDDDLADTDLCVFVADRLPTLDERKQRYRKFGISDHKYLDGDLEVSRIDGFRIDDADYDFLWMSLPEVEQFLLGLPGNHECDEYLPGGLLTVQPLFDPQGHIDRLGRLVPTYSEERARSRVKGSVDKAHFSFYSLAGPTKAPFRSDYFSFFFNQWTVLDSFVSGLFALNRQWRAHEKRVIDQIHQLGLAPSRVSERMRAVMLYQDENTNLAANARNIKLLFSDLVSIAQKEFPGIDLPTEWS